MITGTTGDSSICNTTQNYFTYFIMNTETNTVSDGEPSVYANLIAGNTNSEQYEANVLPFFAQVARRFPHLLKQVGQIEPSESFQQLEMFAAYYMLVEQQQPARPLSKSELCAIDQSLTGFEQLQEYDEDDITDLLALKGALDRALPPETGSQQFERSQIRLDKALIASKFRAI